MKYVISIFLSLTCQAAPIHVFHEAQPERAATVKDIFVTSYMLPEELLAIQEVSSCESMRVKGKLDVCLKNNGDLVVVSVDERFVSESLKIFRAP